MQSSLKSPLQPEHMAQAVETHTAVWQVKAVVQAPANRVKIETLIEKPVFATVLTVKCWP